ncbi:hypothetical protein EC973_000542 [Apophysomyces ossiformis]|uniref:UBR-type domain-containing protein n=1 Tax=Apophysomyces ossiformis TaxID=679940 RepID=A0A8H7BRI4_9FUNG|nr:hypothetical protein EC973_000542 [Apophysomyces ossiformis]
MTDSENHQQEHLVTAVEIVQQQNILEQEAQEALPGKFEKCTFDLGYIRQPLYACKTCSQQQEDQKQQQQLAGMCYSCSIACHGDHELFELFPKRHFRCDCGLSDKFSHPCQLMTPTKQNTQTNDENRYNHNFYSRYCRCDGLYDPEQEDGTMYQCALCEDWFHEACIGNIPPEVEDFESYICRDCTHRHPFLLRLACIKGLVKARENPIERWLIPEGMKKKAKEEKQEDTVPVSVVDGSPKEERKQEEEEEEEKEEDGKCLINNNKRKHEACDDKEEGNSKIAMETKRAKTEEEEKEPTLSCISRVDGTTAEHTELVDLFLPDGWRQMLCLCSKCKDLFRNNKIEYLLMEEKTYEPEEDEDAGKSLFEVGMEKLQRLDRVRALETVMAYQSLAEEVRQFLQGFKESGAVVTEADVKRFFEVSNGSRMFM